MAPMTLEEQFQAAQQRVKTLPRAPANDVLLKLYALYKQGSLGDVIGSRPGMMDFKGRAKYDAWAAKRSMTRDAAMQAYVALVDELFKA
jgi:diazepam-binding inhibitor (GABA receptor modulator, acyl-CoA-binding protein)